jgi:hypothetical protein
MNRMMIVLGTTLLLSALPWFAGCGGSGTAASTPKNPTAAASATYNHDMSAYKKLAEEAMKLAKDGKLAEAFPKSKELEKTFDGGTEDLKKAEAKLWKEIDTQMDVAIDATNPNKGGTHEKATAELQKFIDMLGKVPAK